MRQSEGESRSQLSRPISPSWAIDYDVALEDARNSGRPMLIAFSGPSWSPPCRTLVDRVFSDSKFETWANQHVVLVQVNVPRPESPRSAGLEQMLLKYQVNAFPMVLIVDSDERIHGSIPGSSNDVEVEQWLQEADQIINSLPADQEPES